MIRITENLYEKLLNDVSTCLNCAAWSWDGMLAVFSDTSVFIYCPNFKHMSCYSTNYLGIESVKQSLSSTVHMEESTISQSSFLNFLKVNAAIDTNPINFISLCWSPPGLCPGASSLLLCLLNDGSFIICSVPFFFSKQI